jgi:hypothetical protein
MRLRTCINLAAGVNKEVLINLSPFYCRTPHRCTIGDALYYLIRPLRTFVNSVHANKTPHYGGVVGNGEATVLSVLNAHFPSCHPD